MEASAQLITHSPDVKTQLKLGETNVQTPIAEFGENVHLAKLGDRYIVIIEADQVQFDKHVSPIEFLKPESFDAVSARLKKTKLAKRYNLPVIAFAGQLGHENESIYNHGINAAFSIVPGAIPLTEALDNASDFLTTTAEQIAKLYKMS